MKCDDVLTDVADELVREGIDADKARLVLERIRRRWGGQEVYICQHDRRARNNDIKNALSKGVPTKEISKRVGVSITTIRRRKSEWL